MSDVTRYRWSRAYGLRFLGVAIVALAVFWLVAALTAFADWSVVLLAIAAVSAVVCAVRFLWLPPVLLEISSAGYRVSGVRGSGVASAVWADVETVTATLGGSEPVMVITLRDGRSTTVPVGLIGPYAVNAEREMHTRLNAAFGYRRLDLGSATRDRSS